MSDEPKSSVEYSKVIAIVGMGMGLFLALMLPLLFMLFVKDFGADTLKSIIIASVVTGGVVIVVSVFVGTLIPSRVDSRKSSDDAK